MRKFIKHIGGKSSRTEHAGRPGDVPAADQLPPELQRLAEDPQRYGLWALPLPSEGSPADSAFPVSVIAVHGLGGDFFRTWASRAPQKPTYWLAQLLPADLPGARVFSFGYDSAPTFSRSLNGIGDAAQDLLHQLKSINAPGRPPSPIIFVCHSLGGIVVKQALVKAHEDAYFADVLRATRVIVFMGTPHRGSQIAAALRPLAALVNFGLDVSGASMLAGSMRTDLIHTLSRDSVRLDEIHQSFKRRAKSLMIISCYERVKPPGSASLVVEKQSAVLGLPEEIEIPIQADHMSMCRFASRKDPGYGSLTRAIVHAVEQMVQDISCRSFTLSETKFVAAFGQRADVPVDEPLQGTCTWSVATQAFRDWQVEPGPAVLWLTGDAGCGKTVLTNFLVRVLSGGGPPSATRDELVCSFFCARDIESQKDARALLKALILQILSLKKDAVHPIRAAFV